MAKVRIQARSADSEDLANSQSNPKPHSYHHQRGKHIGALDILVRIWKREGFIGWYQVITICVHGVASFLTFFSSGNASTDHKSCPFTGITFHVEGTI